MQFQASQSLSGCPAILGYVEVAAIPNVHDESDIPSSDRQEIMDSCCGSAVTLHSDWYYQEASLISIT